MSGCAFWVLALPLLIVLLTQAHVSDAQFITIVSQAGTSSAVSRTRAFTGTPPTSGRIYANDNWYWTNCPAPYAGWEFIQLNTGDKTVAQGNTLVTFTLLWEMRVVVFIDQRKTNPSWLDSSWTDAAVTMTASSGVVWKGYYQVFPPAFPVAIGGMGCSAGDNNCANLYVMAMLNPGYSRARFYANNPAIGNAMQQMIKPPSGSVELFGNRLNFEISGTYVRDASIAYVDFGSGTNTVPSDGSVAYGSRNAGSDTSCPFNVGCLTPTTATYTGFLTDGFMVFPETATYSIYTRSDDGSRWWVWNTTSPGYSWFHLDNDFAQGIAVGQRLRTMPVNAGPYRFRIGFWNQGSDLGIQAGLAQTTGQFPFGVRNLLPTDVFMSSDAYLRTLAPANLSSGLSPDFAPYILTYSLKVPNQISRLGWRYTVNQYDSVVAVVSVSSGDILALALGVSTFTLTVVAQDGRTNKSYTIAVERFAPEVNACVANPCAAVAGIVCTDSADYLNGTSSRLCSTCPPGTLGDPYVSCIDIDACNVTPCGSNTQCVDKLPPNDGGASGRTCTCSDGYTGNAETGCTEINGCVATPCGANTDCTDLPPPAGAHGRNCLCKLGFGGDAETGCTDLNACAVVNQGCAANAVCTDTPAPALGDASGRTCACSPGYSGVDAYAGGCSNINACVNAPCATSYTVCTDLNPPAGDGAGGRTCACMNGATGDAYNAGCNDINACANAACAAQQTCTDLLPPASGDASGRNCGSFDCANQVNCATLRRSPCVVANGPCTTCSSGFVGWSGSAAVNGTTPCCANNCQALNRAQCTVASAQCGTCFNGFTDAGVGCSDINECGTNNGGCALTPRVQCFNTFGASSCGSCPAGYNTLNGGAVCQDIDECTAGTSGCDPDANCFNRDGSAFCVCADGFTGNGNSCTVSAPTVTASTGTLELAVADALVASPATMNAFRTALPALLALLLNVPQATVFVSSVEVTGTGLTSQVARSCAGAGTYATVMIHWAVVGAVPNAAGVTQWSGNCTRLGSTPVTQITGGTPIGVGPTVPTPETGVEMQRCSDGVFRTACGSGGGGGGSPAAAVAAAIVVVSLFVIFFGLVYNHMRKEKEGCKESMLWVLCCCGAVGAGAAMRRKNKTGYDMELGSGPEGSTSPKSTSTSSGHTEVVVTTPPGGASVNANAHANANPFHPTGAAAAAGASPSPSAKSGTASNGAMAARARIAEANKPKRTDDDDEDEEEDETLPVKPASPPKPASPTSAATPPKPGSVKPTASSPLSVNTAAAGAAAGAAGGAAASPTSLTRQPSKKEKDKEKDKEESRPASHTVSTATRPGSPSAAAPASPGSPTGSFFASLLKKKDATKSDDTAAATPTAKAKGGAAKAGAATEAKSDRTLEDVLASHAGREAFGQFLKKELSGENLSFWMEVEKYRSRKRKLCETMDPKSAPLRKEMKPMAIQIYNKYLSKTDINSANVNVPEDVDARLASRLQKHFDQGVDQEGESAEKTVFDEAQEVIFKLMESDSWKRFVKSPDFAKLHAASQ